VPTFGSEYASQFEESGWQVPRFSQDKGESAIFPGGISRNCSYEHKFAPFNSSHINIQ
jgi:hypothetical protein